MPSNSMVVIGASAGGIEALMGLFRHLPADLPVAVLVALHYPPKAESMLADVLDKRSQMSVSFPDQGEAIQPGHIYLAPPDLHMMVNDSRIQLEHGPRENGFRPSIDPLFRTAAAVYGPRTIGVILSGSLGDGVAGLKAIKDAGGVTIVQDPSEALIPALPNNAIQKVEVDHVLPVGMIAEVIKQAAVEMQPQAEGDGMSEDHEEKEAVQEDIQRFEAGEQISAEAGYTPTMLTCPECGGVLWEFNDGTLIHYRCHVGHAYSDDAMLAEQSKTLESAMWSAVRTLVERSALLKRMAERAGEKGNPRSEAHFLESAREAEQQAEIIRRALVNGWKDPEAE